MGLQVCTGPAFHSLSAFVEASESEALESLDAFAALGSGVVVWKDPTGQ